MNIVISIWYVEFIIDYIFDASILRSDDVAGVLLILIDMFV